MRATSRSTCGLDAAHFRHRLGRKILNLGLQRLEAGDVGLDILLVIELFIDDDMQQRVQHGDVAAGLEAQRLGGVAHQILAARIHDDQLGAALDRLLEIGGGDRMVGGRPSADDDDAFGLHGVHERRRDRARADTFHQRGDRGGVAEPVQWSTLLVPKPCRTNFWKR